MTHKRAKRWFCEMLTLALAMGTMTLGFSCENDTLFFVGHWSKWFSVCLGAKMSGFVLNLIKGRKWLWFKLRSLLVRWLHSWGQWRPRRAQLWSSSADQRVCFRLAWNCSNLTRHFQEVKNRGGIWVIQKSISCKTALETLCIYSWHDSSRNWFLTALCSRCHKKSCGVT